jgi:hypothetical protein
MVELPLWICRPGHWASVPFPCTLCPRPSRALLAGRRARGRRTVPSLHRASNGQYPVSCCDSTSFYLKTIPCFVCLCFHRFRQLLQPQEVHVRILLCIVSIGALWQYERLERAVAGGFAARGCGGVPALTGDGQPGAPVLNAVACTHEFKPFSRSPSKLAIARTRGVRFW